MSLLSWLGGAAQRVGNTVNNDVVKPIQRDVVQPVQQATNTVRAAVQNSNPPPAPVAQPWGAGRIWNDINNPHPGGLLNHLMNLPVVHPIVQVGQSLLHGDDSLIHAPINAVKVSAADITHNNPAAVNPRAQLQETQHTAGGLLHWPGQAVESIIQTGKDAIPGGPKQQTWYQTNGIEKFLAGPAPVQSVQGAYSESRNVGDSKVNALVHAGLQAASDLPVGLKGASVAKAGIEHAAPVVAEGSSRVASGAAKLDSTAAAKAAKSDPEWNHWNNRVTYANEQASAANTPQLKAQWNAAAKIMMDNRNSRHAEISQGGFVKIPGGGGNKPNVPEVGGAPKPQETPPENLVHGTSNENVKGPIRGTIKTLKASPEVSPETAAKLKGTPLTVRPHAPMREAAQANIDKSLTAATEKAYKDLNQTPGRMTDEQQMNAIKVAQTHDAAGNHETAADIYNKLATHRSRNAQALAVGQELSKRTPEGIRYAAQRTLEKAGVKYEGEVAARVDSLMNDVRATKPGSTERDMATQKLIHEVNGQIPRSKMQATVDLWRAGLLTGPETVAKIASSHLITSPMELATRPVSATVDKAVSAAPDSLLKFLTRNKPGAVAGQRTLTFSPKDYVVAGTKGYAKGVKAAGEHMKTGLDQPNTGGFEKTLGVGHHQTSYEDYVYRVHGSVYKPFYSAAYKIEEANQTRIAQHIFGNDAAKIAQRLQSPKVQDEMTHYAEQFAMQNKTVPGELTQTIQHFKPGGVPIGEWIAPFSRIPAALGVKGIIDYTPIGTVRAAKTLVDGITKGTFDQRKFVESLGKSAAGGTALVGAGAMLMAKGDMTLQAPADPKEKALWQAEGKTRNSINVGGKWISLNAMGPVGIALGIGGAWHRATAGGAGGANAVGQAIGAGAKLIADQPYMKGVTGVGNVLQNPVRYAESYMRNSATSFVPAGVQQTARGTDKVQRAYPDNMKDAVKQAFPGARESTPASNDIFGTPGKGQAAESGKVTGVANPFFPSSEKNKTDPATNELQRLYDALGTKSVSIQPTTNYTVNGKAVKMTTKQQQDMLSATGPAIHDAVNSAIKNPSYQSMSDTDKVKTLTDIFNSYQDQYIKINLNPSQKVNSSQLRTMTSDLSSAQLGSGSGKVNPKLDKGTQSYLTQVNNMSAADRQKTFNTQSEAEYKYNLAKYQNDKANGTLTTAQDIKTQASLAKDKVGSQFPKNIRDLYGLSKNQIADYVSSNPDAATQLENYDQSLYNAGIISKPKFQTGNPSTSRTASSRSSGGTGKAALDKAYAAAGITGSNPYGAKFDAKSTRALLTQTFKTGGTKPIARGKFKTNKKPVLASTGVTKLRKKGTLV